MALEKKSLPLSVLPCSHQDGKARVRTKSSLKFSLLLMVGL